MAHIPIRYCNPSWEAPRRRRTKIMSSIVPMDIKISVSATRSNNLPELQRFQDTSASRALV